MPGERPFDDFTETRGKLNETVLKHADTVIKRIYSLDAVAFRDEGALGLAAKELIALACSLALRCDDCVTWHLGRCRDLGVDTDRVVEALSTACLVGGTITIPHLRRAMAMWDGIAPGPRNPDHEGVIRELVEISSSGGTPSGILQDACATIRGRLDGYDWAGFYLADPGGGRLLRLGPFSGEPTEHVAIEFGSGICGQAAETERTFMIADVRAEENYLSCSPSVISEAVVPVRWRGRLVGELDIDSHRASAFTGADRRFLELAAAVLAPHVCDAADVLFGGSGKGGR
jgi:L-methionine (R)-S-oxide reductase